MTLYIGTPHAVYVRRSVKQHTVKFTTTHPIVARTLSLFAELSSRKVLHYKTNTPTKIIITDWTMVRLPVRLLHTLHQACYMVVNITIILSDAVL